MKFDDKCKMINRINMYIITFLTFKNDCDQRSKSSTWLTIFILP